MFLVKYNTTPNYNFFMADSTDPTQGKTGLTSFTVKTNEAADTLTLNTRACTVSEIGEGWYRITFLSFMSDPVGHGIIQISATGAITWRDTYQIVDELPGNLTDAQIAEIVAKIFRTTMDAIEDSSEGTAITTTNLSLYKAVMSLVGKVALISTTKRIYQTDETTTALDLTMTSGQGPASPFISQEP